MDPVTLAMIMEAQKSAYGWLQLYQAYRAKKDIKPYEIPASVRERFAIAKVRAKSSSPMTNYLENRLNAETTSAYDTLKESSDSPLGYMGGATELYKYKTDRLNDIALQDLQYREQQQANLYAAYSEMAGYESQKSMLDYQRTFDRYTQLKNEAPQNIFGGLQGITNMMLQKKIADEQIEAYKRNSPFYNMNSGVNDALNLKITQPEVNYKLPTYSYGSYYSNPNYNAFGTKYLGLNNYRQTFIE